MTAAKENDGKGQKTHWGAWSKLDKETRERYEGIEERIREKVKRGLL